MNRSVPITANGIIPISQNDVANIPPIALAIPDFEGQAVLRIFSNSTKAAIGCYTATITNGASFSHPAAVGTILGLFTIVALLASFAVAVYGDHIPTMRTHYAHSLSIFVVFAVFHHIFFTGALSVNWPSVLTAWWSNFAWSAGMIYSEPMQNSINKLLKSNFGNVSMVGSAGSGPASEDVGGGYDLSKIYKRSPELIQKRWSTSLDKKKLLQTRNLENFLAKRDATSSNGVDSPWYGQPIRPGLPVPGNYSGLPGTLAPSKIPASNAFMTAFIWTIILLVILVSAVAIFKGVLELLSRRKKLRTHRLDHFRHHWMRYAGQLVLRTLFITFFMFMFLMFFQFTFRGTGGAAAIAAIAFVALFVGMSYLVGATLRDRLRYGYFEFRTNRLHFERSRALGVIPWIGFGLQSRRTETPGQRTSLCSIPLNTIHYVEGDTQAIEVHEDEEFIARRGWLYARFRRTRWWFFAAWLFYEFVRACFFGGAAGHPLVQVFGLLIVEFIALFAIIKTKPFEASRLNALVVYLLGFSKVVTVALSSAFDPQFNLPRISCTIIGVVIIVVQGILVVTLLVATVAGAVTSYLSLARNQEEFRPRHWTRLRNQYFAHLDKVTPDMPAPILPATKTSATDSEPKAPFFSVNSVRRETKIEDDAYMTNEDPYGTPILTPHDSHVSLPRYPPVTARGSRANSISQSQREASGNLPFGARSVHRASWSAKDIETWSAPDSRRQTRHMSAAAGLHHQGSAPGSRQVSMQLNHQRSDGSLRWQLPGPTIEGPGLPKHSEERSL